MKMLNPISGALWALILLVVTWLLYIIFLIARARTALRTIEKTHIVNPNDNFHEDVDFSAVPRKLHSLVGPSYSQTQSCGFHEFLTGRRMRLKMGRANTYYHVFVSEDHSTVAEFIHVRVAMVLSIWPAPLPLSNLIGPTICSFNFETIFSDHTTLITTSDLNIVELALPSFRVNILPDSISFTSRWESHRQEQERLKHELGLNILLFNGRNNYFEKECIQRQQIAVKQTREMKKLREENMANIWDSKPQ